MPLSVRRFKLARGLLVHTVLQLEAAQLTVFGHRVWILAESKPLDPDEDEIGADGGEVGVIPFLIPLITAGGAAVAQAAGKNAGQGNGMFGGALKKIFQPRQWKKQQRQQQQLEQQQQPGMMQPGMMQPGMMQPGMMPQPQPQPQPMYLPAPAPAPQNLLAPAPPPGWLYQAVPVGQAAPGLEFTVSNGMLDPGAAGAMVPGLGQQGATTLPALPAGFRYVLRPASPGLAGVPSGRAPAQVAPLAFQVRQLPATGLIAGLPFDHVVDTDGSHHDLRSGRAFDRRDPRDT